jgi:hypothetical protein
LNTTLIADVSLLPDGLVAPWSLSRETLLPAEAAHRSELDALDGAERRPFDLPASARYAAPLVLALAVIYPSYRTALRWQTSPLDLIDCNARFN